MQIAYQHLVDLSKIMRNSWATFCSTQGMMRVVTSTVSKTDRNHFRTQHLDYTEGGVLFRYVDRYSFQSS